MRLLDKVIDHQIPDNVPSKGLPIGNLTSQYFANLYLGELDHFLKDKKRVKFYLRYMDDFLLFSREKQYLRDLLPEIEWFLEERLTLRLKESVTRLAPVSDGVPFLGFRIFSGLIRLKRENAVRLRRKLRAKETAFRNGEIPVEQLSRSIASMFAHASHANSVQLRRMMMENSMRFG